MDQATLNGLVARGLGQAATRLGAPFCLTRPNSSSFTTAQTIAPAVYLAYGPIAALQMMRGVLPDKPYLAVLMDSTLMLVGDYLVGTETLFITRLDAFRPPEAVLCNATLDILSASTATQAGTNSYGGLSAASSTQVAAGWPASLLVKMRTELDPTKLPSDAKSAYYTALLPAIPDVEITAGMQLADASGNLYLIIGSELSSFGWLLTVAMQTS